MLVMRPIMFQEKFSNIVRHDAITRFNAFIVESNYDFVALFHHVGTQHNVIHGVITLPKVSVSATRDDTNTFSNAASSYQRTVATRNRKLFTC